MEPGEGPSERDPSPEVSGRGCRKKVLTEKGKEYEITHLQKNCKSTLLTFNKSMSKLQLVIAKSDWDMAQEIKGEVEADFAAYTYEHALLTSALEDSDEVQKAMLSFTQSMECYNKIMATMRHLNSDEDDVSIGESASEYSGRSSRCRSVRSDKSHRSRSHKSSKTTSERVLNNVQRIAEQESILRKEVSNHEHVEYQLRQFEAEVAERRSKLQSEVRQSKQNHEDELQRLSILKEEAETAAFDTSRLERDKSTVHRYAPRFQEDADYQVKSEIGHQMKNPHEFVRSTDHYRYSRPVDENMNYRSYENSQSTPYQQYQQTSPENIWHNEEYFPRNAVQDQYLYPYNSNYVKRSVRLPPEELNVFDGTNVLEYPVWRKRFKDLIEKHVFDASRRISYLMNYTSGEAKEAIEGFIIEATDESYAEAMSTLDRWYGDQLSISKEYKKKLQNWPVISTNDGGKSFRKFSNFLNSCKRLIPDQGYRPTLDDEELNQKLVVKLPRATREIWSRKVYTYKENRKRDIQDAMQRGHDIRTEIPSYPPFTMFADHVQEEAFIASQPVVGTAVMDQIVAEQKRTIPHQVRYKYTKKTSSFSTNVDNKDKDLVKSDEKLKHVACMFCQQFHALDECQEFKEKPYDFRVEFVKKHGLCFRCMKYGHISKGCRHALSCSICNKRHPTVLHSDQYPETTRKQGTERRVKQTNVSSDKVTRNSKATCLVASAAHGVRTTRIVPVYVYQNENKDLKYKTYCALDEQSDTCFISEELCKRLNVKSVQTTIRINCMGAGSTTDCMKVMSLYAESCDGKIVKLPPCYSQKEIPVNRDQIVTKKMILNDPSFKEIVHEIPEFDADVQVGLLLGTDCLKALKPVKVISDPKSESYAIKTSLGWGIVGLPTSKGSQQSKFCNRIQSYEASTSLLVPLTDTKELISPREIQRSFERDFSEYKPMSNLFMRNVLPFNQQISVEDRRFIEKCESSVKVTEDGHYELDLPFRDKDPKISNNRPLAVQRLKSVKRRMKQDAQYKAQYFDFMKKLIKKGLAVKAENDNDDNVNSGKRWYLIHHGVYHPMKPGKIRVVYDGSAIYKGQNLNDMLYPGPCLTNRIDTVLMRFRKGKFCWTADIEQMFYSVYLSPKHQNFFRFLFWEDEDIDKDPIEYKMRVHSFGISSSPGCSIYALMKTAEDNKSEFGESISSIVTGHSYVDDILFSCDSLEEAASTAKLTKDLCKKGGFKLTKYAANLY